MPESTGTTPAGSDPRALLARWVMDRRVTDRLAGMTGRMLGTLTVSGRSGAPGASGTPSSGGLRWEEEGVFSWAGKRLAVHRRLALSLVEGEWWMTFENGGLFHRWQPGEPLEHPCGADRYLGRLHLDPAGRQLRVLWDVTGPGKRQRIFTRCRRATDAQADAR